MIVGVGGGVVGSNGTDDVLLRLVFRRMPGTVWAVDRSLCFTYAVGRLVDAAGTSSTEIVGKTVQEFLGTKNPTDPGVAHHLAALAGEPQSFDYQFRDRWYAVFIDPLKLADGKIVGCVGAAIDVTERRVVEQRLAISEARLAEAQRTAHIGSYEWDAATNVVTWTDELHRIMGLPPGQSVQTLDAYMALVHPDDVEATHRALMEASAGGPFEYRNRIVRADGGVRWIQTRGEVTKNAEGRVTRMIGSSWDVTELTEATQARERLLSLLQATIEATEEGILVVDRQRRVVLRNRRFLSLWKIPVHLEDCDDDLVLLGYVRDQLERPDEFLLEVERLHANPELEDCANVRCADGRVFERYSAPQRIGPNVVGRIWSFRDVTERERQLRSALFLSDATRLLTSLDVERALDGVARIALPFMGTGCVVDLFIDGGPRRLVAVSTDPRSPTSPELHPTVLGRNSIVYQSDGMSVLAVPLLIQQELAGAITFAAPLRRRYAPEDVAVAEELARRAALALDNATLYRRAKDALHTRDELLSIAAHEIRGPLTAIHLAAQTIRKGKASPDSIRNLLAVVEREDRRLSRFVEELLDMGRFREGRFQLKYEPVSLGEVVRDVAGRLDPDLVRSGSSLSVLVDQNVIGKWDRFRLEQVVTNLLSNAIKYGLGRPIEVRIRAEEGCAFLSVTDRGIGIQPEVVPRLFRPFERGVSERHYGGLGLGLHIVKSIVEAMRGSVTVSVESSPGGGTTFVVELPTGENEANDAQ
jgi:PAS domain S-box-containing protein